jgi:hypothetical protein
LKATLVILALGVWNNKMDKNLMAKKSLKGFVQILLLSLSTLFLRLCYFSCHFALLLVTLFFVLIISIFW